MLDDEIGTGPTDTANPYRVLSLDGGGSRGVYAAAFLDRLMRQFGYRNCRTDTGPSTIDFGLGFDLITGTSTGAIIGCGLAAGVPLCDIVALYRDHGPAIFPHRITGIRSVLFRAMRGSYYVRKGDKALRAALNDVLGDTTMRGVYEQRGISLSIPAVRMSSHKAYVFKKTGTSGVRDDDYRLADVCLATSAAPIYRSLAAIQVPGEPKGTRQVFADGGLWANNPVMVGLTDALVDAAPDRPIEIYSLGTCPRPEGEHIRVGAEHRSMMDWRLGADVGPLAIAAQEFAYDNMARLLARALTECGRPVRTIRFPNKAVPSELMPFLSLDDTRSETMDRLIQQAHYDVDMTLSACDNPDDADGRMINGLMQNMLARGTVHSLSNAGS